MTQIVDFAWGRPSPAHIKAAGYVGVARYLSHDPGKAISATEAGGYLSAGLSITLVFEDGAQNALGGAGVGSRDGAFAKAQAEMAGAGARDPILFAVDFQATAGQMASVDQYGEAFAQAVAPHPAGPYGDYDVVQSLPDLPEDWQTVAWSAGRVSGRALLYQRVQQVTIDGVTCDVNDVLSPNYPAWRPGSHPQEDDMAIAITEDAAGNIHVAGVTPQGHPLLFTRSTNGAVSVTDLTDAVAAANPNDHTSYTVQP